MIIAFTVHNRPVYLRETLESWSRVRGISNHLLLFSCEPGCDEAVQVCQEADFAPGVITRNGQRLGVLGNPHAALDRAFIVGYPDTDFAILAEEDLTVSPDVLDYFTWAQRYAAVPKVLGVTTHQHTERAGGLSGAGTADWSDPGAWHFWVWGTWRDRWEHLLRDSWDFTYTENGGGPLQRGWDWAIRNRFVLGAGMTMIAPSMSRSQHIGRYGGSHCSPADFDVVASRCFAGLDVAQQDYQEVSACPAR